MSRLLSKPRPTIAAVATAALLCTTITPATAGVDAQGSGPVGLADLIRLGLQNNAEVVELRHEIPVAEARKRAARDLPDPQLRFRKSWGFNEVPPPYHERRVGHEDVHVTRAQVDQDGKVTETSSIERRNTVTDRVVTPGRDSTVIKEQTRESRGENSTILPGNARLGELGGRESDNRNIYTSSTESQFRDFDPFASEEDIGVQLRFYVPNPKIRKAKLAEAQLEIDLARAELKAAEHRVVLRIRELYEELQYLKTKAELLSRGNNAANTYQSAQDRILEEGGITIFDIDHIDTYDFEAEFVQDKFESLRRTLAARVGLNDATRIRVTDRLVSPSIDLDHTHLEYLIRTAFTHRGEIASVLGKGRIAEARLKGVNAKRIPWFDYVQLGAGRAEQGSVQTDTSWSVQFAMSLPIFSLFGHEHEIYEAKIASFYAQQEANQGIITGEVSAAYQGVKSAINFRARARAKSMDYKKQSDAFLAKFQGDDQPMEGKDQLNYERTRFRIARTIAKSDEDRLNAERRYNQALIELENALGVPLDRAFDGGGGKSAEALASAEPAPTPSTKKSTAPKTDEKAASKKELAATKEEAAAPASSPPAESKRKIFKSTGDRHRRAFGKKRR